MIRPPYIRLYIANFALDTRNMTKSQKADYLDAVLEAYRTGEIPEKFASFSLMTQLVSSKLSYSLICARNKHNRLKSTTCSDQSSTSGQPVVNDPLTITRTITKTKNKQVSQESSFKGTSDDEKQNVPNSNIGPDFGKNDAKDSASKFERSITFEQFWNEYPSIGRIAKESALNAYCVALKSISHAMLMDALRQKSEDIWKFKYTAERWLMAGLWKPEGLKNQVAKATQPRKNLVV